MYNPNAKPYHFEIPNVNGQLYVSDCYYTIEQCVYECKLACEAYRRDYNDRDVKLFMTDSDGVWEVTEEGELAN
jgi:hypothetical protein